MLFHSLIHFNKKDYIRAIIEYHGKQMTLIDHYQHQHQRLRDKVMNYGASSLTAYKFGCKGCPRRLTIASFANILGCLAEKK